MIKLLILSLKFNIAWFYYIQKLGLSYYNIICNNLKNSILLNDWYYLCKLTIRITSFVVTAKLIIQISIKLILDDPIANNGISGIPSHYHFMYFSLCDSSIYTTFEKCDRVLCDRVLKRSFHLLQTLHIITRSCLYLGHYYYIEFKITHM